MEEEEQNSSRHFLSEASTGTIFKDRCQQISLAKLPRVEHLPGCLYKQIKPLSFLSKLRFTKLFFDKSEHATFSRSSRKGRESDFDF